MEDFRRDDGDLKLVRLAQAGNRGAFEGLVERYKKKAFLLALNFTHDYEEAKDLSQEAFLRTFKNLGSFNGRATFYTWFYRILVNLCLDYSKLRGKMAMEPLNENVYVPGKKDITDTVAKRRLETALEALAPKQRAAFLLKHHHELSVRDIAKITGSAEGTVKANIHRAILALRESLSAVLSV